jgi:hypothetical protein
VPPPQKMTRRCAASTAYGPLGWDGHAWFHQSRVGWACLPATRIRIVRPTLSRTQLSRTGRICSARSASGPFPQCSPEAGLSFLSWSGRSRPRSLPQFGLPFGQGQASSLSSSPLTSSSYNGHGRRGASGAGGRAEPGGEGVCGLQGAPARHQRGLHRQ